MASPLTLSHAPMPRSRSSKIGVIRPSCVGPTFNNKLPPKLQLMEPHKIYQDLHVSAVVNKQKSLMYRGKTCVGPIALDLFVEQMKENVFSFILAQHKSRKIWGIYEECRTLSRRPHDCRTHDRRQKTAVFLIAGHFAKYALLDKSPQIDYSDSHIYLIFILRMSCT